MFCFIFHAPDSIVSFNEGPDKILRFLVGEHKIEGNFQSGGSLGWNYGTEYKVFDLGNFKNIKKIRKTINPIVETERSHG